MPRGTHPNSLANLKKGKATQFGANGDTTAKEAGRKSGESRAERKTFREGLLLLLNEPILKDGKPSGKNTQDAIIAGLVKRAVNGETRAFEMIRDTIGEKPEAVFKMDAMLKSWDFEIIVEPEAGDADADQD